MDALDSKKFTKEEIAVNYEQLVEKWGELSIAQIAGVSVKFIDIKEAFFNGASITYFVLTIIFLLFAIVIGKILFPQLANMYTNNNEQMVDLATLQTQETVKKIKKQEDWF